MSNVIRIRKEQNFTVISNDIFKDTQLSLKAKGLLATMLSLPADWNFSTLGLVKLSNDGETAVRSALKELEQNGYLKRELVHENGAITDWKYTIYEERQNEDFSKKHKEKNQHGENNHVEDLGQLSTNILRTNRLNTEETISKDMVHSDERSTETPTENISTPRRKPLFDTEEEKPKRKKGNLFERCVEEAKNRYHDELLTVVLEYLSYRIKSKQHGFGFQVWVNLLNKLDTLADFDQEKVRIVEQSLQMHWDTFAELKSWNRKTGCERFGETEDMRSGVPVGEVLDIVF